MAVYQFSALSDGQAITFNPNVDRLNFDQSSIAAADIRLTIVGTSLRIDIVSGPQAGKDITLQNTSQFALTTTNVTFANGSRLLLGDNTTGTTADNSANSLTGTAGNDQLNGFGGADTLNGGLGNDVYFVSTGDAIVDAGGIDIVYADVSWSFSQGSGLENLTLIGSAALANGNELNNVIIGNSSANSINGRAGNDSMYGMAGNDSFVMSTGGTSTYGNDFIDGGAGVDTVDFGANARSALIISLAFGTMSGGGDGGSGTVSVVNVENVVGGSFNDRMTGNASANFLFGGAGNDTLNGGAGADRLEGGTGLDQYVFSAAPGTANADTVVGFATASDKIVLDASAYTNLGASGNFAAGDARFAAGAGFASGGDTSDRVVYNTTTGQLWYDADGSGTGAAQLIATLQGAPSIAATDIAVISSGPTPIVGTAGNDWINGTPGHDTVQGLGGNDVLSGAGGDDRLEGGSGNDTLVGSDGSDMLIGGDGADVLNGEGGVDTLDGGLGDDYYLLGAEDVLIDAGGIDSVDIGGRDWTLPAGIENAYVGFGATLSIFGNELNNAIFGHSWSSRLEGRGGNDFLDGAAGDDTLLGNEGNDILLGGAGVDVLDGGTGNDSLDGGVDADTLYGGLGNDQLTGGGGFDGFLFDQPSAAQADFVADFQPGGDKILLDGNGLSAAGASGSFAPNDPRFWAGSGASSAHDADDRIIYNTLTGDLYYDADGNGSVAAQRIATLQGAPAISATDIAVINGSSPGPVINGTEGNDSIDGTASNDTILGHGGVDTIRGAGGHDWIDGGAGGANFSFLFGDSGNDTLVGGANSDYLEGGIGNDQVFAGDGNDNIAAGAGDDYLSGGAGRDSFSISEFQTPGMQGYGNDTIDGGDGELDDIFVKQASALSVDLGAGTLTGGALGSATIQNIERFFVWEEDIFNDRIVGNASANHLTGGGGNDVVNGAGGDDWVDGGMGNDTVTGGAGTDNFRYQETPGAANADRITDFASGVDLIWLDGHMHRGIGGNGRFTAGDERFYAAPGAASGHDATDRVVYDTSSGNLWFDADGNGSGAAQLIATLQPGAALAPTDIMVENAIVPFVFQGGPGAEEVWGDEMGDTLSGGGGDDILRGFGGNDVLNGEDGNDTLDGGEGTDRLDGGQGNDTYIVTSGDILVADPGGIDTLQTSVSWNISPTAIENVIVTGSANVNVDGNALANLIIGNDSANVVNARAGSDTIYGNGGNDSFLMSMGGTSSFGNDWIDGGSGSDLVEFGANAQSALVADLAAGWVTGGEAGGGGSSTILNMERFIAGNFADRVSGNASANNFYGGLGNDTLLGLAGSDSLNGADGNDRLDGGSSVDTLFGGAGGDSFVFTASAGSANADRISDFAAGTDQLLFENAVFTGLGVNADWAAGDGRFYAAAGATSAHDTSDRLVYNTTNGNLYYDADGAGGAAAQLVATLANLPALSASDITVI